MVGVSAPALGGLAVFAGFLLLPGQLSLFGLRLLALSLTGLVSLALSLTGLVSLALALTGLVALALALTGLVSLALALTGLVALALALTGLSLSLALTGLRLTGLALRALLLAGLAGLLRLRLRLRLKVLQVLQLVLPEEAKGGSLQNLMRLPGLALGLREPCLELAPSAPDLGAKALVDAAVDESGPVVIDANGLPVENELIVHDD
jgi:hypothetical protein